MISGWNNESIRAGTHYESGIPEFENYADEPITEMSGSGDRWGDDEKQFEKFRNAIHRARNLEVRHRYREAVLEFRKVSQAQRIQSLAKDREELIEAGVTSKTKGYKEYLRYRYLLEFGYDKEKERAIYSSLKSLEVDPRVKPHVAYTLADSAKEPIAAYQQVAKDYPQNPRSEAALIMAARGMVSEEGGNWDRGIATFKEILAKYPRTRFSASIDGWLAANELKKGQSDKAASYYVKQSRSSIPWERWKGHQGLSSIAANEHRNSDAIAHLLIQRSLPVSNHFRYMAAKQIRSSFDSLKPSEVQAIQKRIRRDPQLLASYLDFRLEDTALNPSQERNLLSFISSSLESVRANSQLYSRVAQLQYNAGRYRDAISMARRAMNDKGDAGARAMYILGSSLSRTGSNHEAIKTLESLYRRPTKNYIHQSAGEYLAILQEKHGNPTRALAVYGDLDYSWDFAFLADSVLTPSQLKSAIQGTDTGEKRDALRYTLAMRYFRKEDYASAKSILTKMPRPLRLHKGLTSKKYKEFVESTYFEKMPPHEIDPLTDVTKMQRLRSRAEHGKTKEIRAEAIYGLAQYAHKRRNLMYYSAGLWKGGRADSFGIFWNKNINKGASERIARSSAFEHECEGQTVKFCEELIRRYPRSRLAPKALYTAGVATARLSYLNSWWGEEHVPLLKKAAKFMSTVVKKYPHNSLAKPAAKYADEFKEEMKPEY